VSGEWIDPTSRGIPDAEGIPQGLRGRDIPDSISIENDEEDTYVCLGEVKLGGAERGSRSPLRLNLHTSPSHLEAKYALFPLSQMIFTDKPRILSYSPTTMKLPEVHRSISAILCSLRCRTRHLLQVQF
jgi:hypothetical protein